MINWDYNANDYDVTKTGKSNLLPEGKYRVRIIEAYQTKAYNGTEGLEIWLNVIGHNHTLRHYIWYNHDNKVRTNQLLGEFFDSFDIQDKDRTDHSYWYDKEGAVYVVQGEYKGRTIAKIAFCISRNQQEQVPERQETPSTHVENHSRYAGFEPMNDKFRVPVHPSCGSIEY